MRHSLADVKLYDIYNFSEENGNIAFIEASRDIPFPVKRNFYVYGVRTGDVRGYHAHKECKQFLVCLRGMVTITCDDGKERKAYNLGSPTEGLYIPSMIWAEQFYHSRETILLGLASHHFEESDYIRDYESYRKLL